MPNINVTVKNKIATGDGTKIICGNSDYIVNFVFDDEWNDFTTKTMRVQHGDTFTDVVFQGNSATLPIISAVLGVKIGVFAGNLHTTTSAYFDSVKSILCEGGTPAPPTDDVYEQIMELLNQISGANPATREKLGVIKVGDNLNITADGVLSVDTANAVEQDNTKPVTSAAVHVEIGNIEALLAAL